MKRFLLALLFPLLAFITVIQCKDRNKTTTHYTCGVAANRINDFSLDTSIKLVYVNEYKWDQKELKVYFQDITDENLIARVLKQANRWKPYTGIKFMQVVSIAESNIRVAFREGNGFQSVIGNLADTAKFNSDFSPTMFLADLDKEEEKEFNRVVMHEFGHALGLLHELQSINSPINWDSAAVYTYYDTVYHWDQNKVNKNILTPATIGEATAFDPKSIMIYGVPKFLMKDHDEIPWPEDLSRTDKQKIKILYP